MIKSLEKSLELATTIVAYCRADLTDIAHLQEQLDESLYDLVHMFCYQSRKAIEQSELIKTINKLDICPHVLPTWGDLRDKDSEFEVQFSSRSFWWIINRIIHSQTFTVLRLLSTKERGEQVWKITCRDPGSGKSSVVSFRSDYDQDEQLHYVDISALVVVYIKEIVPLLEKKS